MDRTDEKKLAEAARENADEIMEADMGFLDWFVAKAVGMLCWETENYVIGACVVKAGKKASLVDIYVIARKLLEIIRVERG